MNKVRSRGRVLRVTAAVLVLGFGTLGFTGGLLSRPSAEATVRSFLLAWEEGQYRTAAGLTTGKPATVAAALRSAYTGLDAAAFYLSMGPITQDGASASARFGVSVDLGQDGVPWTYRGQVRLRRTSSGWKILWAPSVISPRLGPGLHLAVVSAAPPRAELLDASGAPLQTPSSAYVAGVQPGNLRDPAVTARDLGRATGLDASQILGWILAAPRSEFLELLALRPSRYASLKSALSRVPGLEIRQETLRLFTSIAPAVVGQVGTEASAVLRDQGVAYRPGATIGLSGLQQVYQQQLAGTPTTEVVAETSSGRPVSVLARWPGTPARPVRTTIDAGVQQAADAAVGSQPVSAAVVAVQASTGHILAVAEHTAPGLPAIAPLSGRYQPGGVFTIVSTQALLASGLQVSAPIRCPSEFDVGGQTFTNLPPLPQLAAQPSFQADFAGACTTAFTGLSQRLTAHDLAAAAAGFGLGAQWRLGLPAFSGSVSVSGNVAGLAADTIGTGDEQVSPLAMAMIAAQVDTGVGHTPSLVAGGSSTDTAAGTSLTPASLATLRSLMVSAVSSGAGNQADLPGQPVAGQVGTVAPGPGTQGAWAHWFVGYRGGIAFAVLTLSHSSVPSAVPAAAAFLSAAPAAG